jgi:hypothetical protein
MTMGVCSDNGYIQTLQEYQVNPEKLSKIVLLTSYDTTIHIQRLTYTIIQWSTIFCSKKVSPNSHNCLAGPHTKGVTPLEDLVRVPNLSIESTVETNRTSAARKPCKKRKPRLNIPPSCAPATFTPIKTPAKRKPKIKEVQETQQKKQGDSDKDSNVMTGKQVNLRSRCDISKDGVGNPSNSQLAAPRSEPLEDPDSQVIHPFESQPSFQMGTQGSTATAAGLFSQFRGRPPLAGSMAGTAASAIAIKPDIGPPHLASRLHSPQDVEQPCIVSLASYLIARRSEAESEHLQNPHSRTDQNKELALGPQVSSIYQVSPALSPPRITKRSFVHVPTCNRAESATYDPDRFLYQHSNVYLRYNHDTLNAITTYASNNYLTLPQSERPKLRLRIKIAQILVTRLFLALQVQALEDKALGKGVCCSLLSDNGRRDAFTHDWEMYATLSRAMRGRVGRSMSEMAQRAFQSGRAKADYRNIFDG